MRGVLRTVVDFYTSTAETIGSEGPVFVSCAWGGTGAVCRIQKARVSAAVPVQVRQLVSRKSQGMDGSLKFPGWDLL